MVRSSVLSHRVSLNSKGARVATMLASETLWLSQLILNFFMFLSFARNFVIFSLTNIGFNGVA